MSKFQNINEIKFSFGSLRITEKVASRLNEQGFTVQSLLEAVELHKLGAESDEAAIYVSTYAKYNSGSLRGMWVNLASFADFSEFVAFCNAINADESDVEVMAQDFQGFPEELYSECFGSSEFDAVAHYLELCEEFGVEVVNDYAELVGVDYLDSLADAFVGQYDSEEDFAEEIVGECYNLDAMGDLAQYFDYARFARDLFAFDYRFGSNGYVFAAI